MDKAKKNTVIHAAADRMTANYKSSQIPMYGDALRCPTVMRSSRSSATVRSSFSLFTTATATS